MSRFFVKYDSDSSSEEEDLISSEEENFVTSSDDSDFFQNDSDEESSLDSDSDGPKGPSYFLKSKFTKSGGQSDSDDDSDDERKVVKSGKEKLFDDMNESIDKLNVAKRINNWIGALNEFEKLGKLLTRCYQQNLGTPNFYIKLLGNLEDFINEVSSNNEQDSKKMAADQSRAFNSLRQRLKKQIKLFQDLYDLYKEDPDRFDSEEPVDSIQETPNLNGNFTTVGVNKLLSPVFQVLKTISESRGKKNIDKYEQIQSLEALMGNTKPEKIFELISLYQMLISIRFDATSNQSFMPLDQWLQNLKDINEYLDILHVNLDTYQVSEYGKPTDDIDIEPEKNEHGVKIIYGSINSFIERLDDEFIKSLQNTDPHSIEYIQRLKDESSIYKLIVKGQLYIEAITPKQSQTDHNQLSRIILKRLEHVYYKPDQLIKSNELEAWNCLSKDADSVIVKRSSDPVELVQGLISYLKNDTNFSQRALLSQIYYLAINNDYHKAKEIFLQCQIYAVINNAESSLQIIYNRALVQLGLSAFRRGLIEESHQCLNEITNSLRLKELLGQGFTSKFPNQASVTERQKLLPFHMHINLELLECVFMTCSLLIEIPALANSNEASLKQQQRNSKTLVKSFKSKLEFYDRQYFTGPPESIKDHIIHAAKALQKGNWLKAYALLSSIQIWKLFPNNSELLAMMKNQLQIEGLRTYIFTYKSIYSNLSIATLSSKFELSSETVAFIVSKMLEAGDISGNLNDDKTFINFTRNEPQRTKLQELAIVMKEKIGILTEKNEKTASNGYSRKLIKDRKFKPEHIEHEESELEGGEDRETPQPGQKEEEVVNKFRYANVNSNNDEFQA